MKKALILIIPLIVIGLLLNLKYSPCDTPVAYKIGQIDPKFKISEESLAKSTETAANVWSDAYGKKLFLSQPKAEVTINLVYDERQSLDSRIGLLENKLNKEDLNLQPQIEQFETRVAKFKADIAALNREIEEWNSRGGAPPEVYESLKKRQVALEAEANKLNEMAEALNQSNAAYNQDINTLNNTIREFNQKIAAKPEEGLFNPADNTITIYFASNRQELIHTLAHELGHALKMGHVDNPRALMYEFTSQTVAPTKEDLDELKYACRMRTIPQILHEKIKSS